MQQIDKLVIDAIEDIVNIRQSNGHVPALATLNEIMNSLRPIVLESLRGLYRNGLITFHKTVNGTQMFGIKEN